MAKLPFRNANPRALSSTKQFRDNRYIPDFVQIFSIENGVVKQDLQCTIGIIAVTGLLVVGYILHQIR
jgi:hypothetical protein